MANKKTYDITKIKKHEHYNDFVNGYFHARQLLRKKRIREAENLYNEYADDLNIAEKTKNFTLDDLYKEKDTNKWNEEKAAMLGVSLAFHNLNIPFEEIKKQGNATAYETGLSHPADLIREYQRFAERFNEFNFFDWIMSFFIDNGYDGIKKQRNELYQRIVSTHILDGKLPTEDSVKRSEIEALSERDINAINFDNFENSLNDEYESFMEMLGFFDFANKSAKYLEVSQYYLKGNFKSERYQPFRDGLSGPAMEFINNDENDNLDNELNQNTSYSDIEKQQLDLKELFDNYEQHIENKNDYVENNFHSKLNKENENDEDMNLEND